MKSTTSLIALALCGFVAFDAGAQSCEAPPSTGPVSILILDSAQRVDAFVATVKDATIVARDRGTVIFADGRVVTADADVATRQLNQLGWGNRSIQVVASFAMRPTAAPRRG